MFIVQVNDNDGVLQDLEWVGLDQAAADAAFLSVCASRLTNWREYTAADVQAILENGYEKFGGGVIMLIDTSNCITDDELRDALTGQPAGDMTVAEVIQDGELPLVVGQSVDRILELCGNNLDACESHEIQGQILFRGSDGKWYTITTESIIGIANPEWAAELIEENKNV